MSVHNTPKQPANMQTNTRHEISSLEKMLSACTGALLTSLLVTPLDVIKTRLQSQALYNSPVRHTSTTPYSATSLTQCCREVFFSANSGPMKQDVLCRLNPSTGSSGTSATTSIECTLRAEAYEAAELVARRQFNGTLDGVSKIIRYEGILSLYRGLTPALVMSVPATVIYFVGYDYFRDYLRDRWVDQNPGLARYAPLIAGGGARTIAATIISPIELFRTRMQSVEGLHGFREVFKSVVRMVRSDGIQTLWRGLPPTLWRDVPFSAIYWTGYEQIKQQLTTHLRLPTGEMLNEFEITFLSGATSGM
ncbi:mitochondrial carrier domain-containing protein, partial [Jimgerdemannia flammicorona]